MAGLIITNMHITLTPPGDGTRDFLIQSWTLYYHDTPPPCIHKA